MKGVKLSSGRGVIVVQQPIFHRGAQLPELANLVHQTPGTLVQVNIGSLEEGLREEDALFEERNDKARGRAGEAKVPEHPVGPVLEVVPRQGDGGTPDNEVLSRELPVLTKGAGGVHVAAQVPSAACTRRRNGGPRAPRKRTRLAPGTA